MNCPMSRDAGNTKTCALFKRHAFGQWNYQPQRNNCVLRGSSERTIGLSAKTPHTPADPSQRHSLADCINRSRAVAVRNDAPVRHSDAKRVPAFLDVAPG